MKMTFQQQRPLRPLLWACVLLLATPPTRANDASSIDTQPDTVNVGDSFERVRTVLGRPESFIGIGDRQVLYYPRGKVELVEDVVFDVELVSEEEATARRIRMEEEQFRLAQRLLEQQLAREAEGRRMRDQKLTDSTFLAAPASRRVAFWQDFAKRYPEVALPPDYDQALREYRLEQEMARTQQREDARMRTLEARVEEAEWRAALAEDTAQRRARRDRYTYPLLPVAPVVVVQPPVACTSISGAYAGSSISIPRRGLGVPPVHAPGFVRPRGVHNAQVHNRALRSSPIAETRFVPFHSSAGYGFQHPRTPSGGISSVQHPAPLPAR